MNRNYWEEYWENYYKFMALYLRELQSVYPNVDIKKEYTEVANLLEPSVKLEDYDEEYYDFDDYGYEDEDRDPPFTFPGGGAIPNPFMPPNPPPQQQPQQQPSTPFISPGGGQFTINNCRRRAIVRIVMRRGFNPSEFFLVVDRADNRSIQGHRIDCQGGRIRFIPMAVEYRNINFIECAL